MAEECASDNNNSDTWVSKRSSEVSCELWYRQCLRENRNMDRHDLEINHYHTLRIGIVMSVRAGEVILGVRLLAQSTR